MTDDDEPEFAEPLLGFRVWTLGSRGELAPLVAGNEPWQPGENRASCISYAHSAPAGGCGCGFNALHHPPRGYLTDPGHAVGAISAWGDVDLFRTGLRAEYASVVALAVPGQTTEAHRSRLRLAARRYRVPLTSLDMLGEVGSEYAARVAREQLPGVHRWGRSPARSRPVPLPRSALCTATAGNGVWIDKHLAIAHKGNVVRVGPTPALMAASAGHVAPLVAIGQEVTDTDALIEVDPRGASLTCPSPVAGVVRAVRDASTAKSGLGAGPRMVGRA